MSIWLSSEGIFVMKSIGKMGLLLAFSLAIKPAHLPLFCLRAHRFLLFFSQCSLLLQLVVSEALELSGCGFSAWSSMCQLQCSLSMGRSSCGGRRRATMATSRLLAGPRQMGSKRGFTSEHDVWWLQSASVPPRTAPQQCRRTGQLVRWEQQESELCQCLVDNIETSSCTYRKKGTGVERSCEMHSRRETNHPAVSAQGRAVCSPPTWCSRLPGQALLCLYLSFCKCKKHPNTHTVYI